MRLKPAHTVDFDYLILFNIVLFIRYIDKTVLTMTSFFFFSLNRDNKGIVFALKPVFKSLRFQAPKTSLAVFPLQICAKILRYFLNFLNYCVSINRCYETKTLTISHFLKDTSFWELYLESNICHGFWKTFSLIYASLGAFQYSKGCFLISSILHPPACDLETNQRKSQRPF